jgi:DNA repair exonuclease SbcCD ATPase subunit
VVIAAEEEVAARNAEVDAMLGRAAEVRRDLVVADRTRQQQTSVIWSEIRKELESKQAERYRLASAVAQRQVLTEELRALLQGVCVTCGAPRGSDRAGEIQKQIDALPGHEHVAALDQEIAIGTQVLNSFRIEADPVLAALDQQVFRLTTSRAQVPEELRDRLRMAERQLDVATTTVQRLKVEYDYEVRRSTERSGVEAELAGARASLREAEVQLAELEDLRHLLRTWISAYFEEVLLDLSERTSQVLTTVPNVEEWRVDFRSEIQTKRGTSRRGVFVVPQHRGEDRSLDGEDLSGGMKSAIYLAVDLALASLVAERTGAALGWLLIDEAFDGLDQPSRERCLEMVQSFAQERGVLVLLVTHSCEVQEALSGVISVEVGPEGSRVQVIEN